MNGIIIEYCNFTFWHRKIVIIKPKLTHPLLKKNTDFLVRLKSGSVFGEQMTIYNIRCFHIYCLYIIIITQTSIHNKTVNLWFKYVNIY